MHSLYLEFVSDDPPDGSQQHGDGQLCGTHLGSAAAHLIIDDTSFKWDERSSIDDVYFVNE
jgi:hypothetical protein